MIVYWTDAAVADLNAIGTYLARHSPQYGVSMIERIFACTEQLAEFPLMRAELPEYEEESLRELIERPYRIVYRVYDDRVDVVARFMVLDGCLVDFKSLIEKVSHWKADN